MSAASILKKAKAGGAKRPSYEQLVEALELSENIADTMAESVDDAGNINEELRRQNSILEARIRVLEAKETEAGDKISTLKAMIRGGEIEKAHLHGYLERVAEDDDVREAMQQTSTHEEARIVSPRQRRNYAGPMVADYDPGPGYVGAQYREDNAKEAMGARMSAARQPTWRDKPWSEW